MTHQCHGLDDPKPLLQTPAKQFTIACRQQKSLPFKGLSCANQCLERQTTAAVRDRSCPDGPAQAPCPRRTYRMHSAFDYFEIEAAVKRIIKEQSISVLLVEQHLHFIRQADWYYAMRKGGIVASGPTRELSQEIIQQFLAV
jgi:hypothetical protein